MTNQIKKIFIVLFIFSIVISVNCSNQNNADDKFESGRQNSLDTNEEIMKNVHDISVKDINGEMIKLESYKGKVLLIVNTASECGFTSQYDDLQKVYEKYNDKGFEILAFPSNDFGGQEPGTNEEIKEFCSTNFGVKFKLFDKSKVIGDNKNQLYKRLTDNPVTSKEEINWNFEKFIISKDGEIVARFKSKVKPTDDVVITVIEEELNKS